MRIAHCIRALIAVLGLAAVFHPVSSEYHHLDESLPHHQRHWNHYFGDSKYQQNTSLYNYNGKPLTPRENQQVLKHEASLNHTKSDCCPSVLEMVEPVGGSNQDGRYVQLFRDGENIQRFYELSCHQDILDKPCRFVDKKLHHQSKCIQKHSYTYALVEDNGDNKNTFPKLAATGPNMHKKWKMDYIRVRSGCACVIEPKERKKRDKKHRKRFEQN